MRVHPLLTLLGCCLVAVLVSETSRAEIPAKDKLPQKEEAAEQEEKQAPEEEPKKEKEQPRRSRLPKHPAAPNTKVVRTPHALLTEQEMFVPEAVKNRQPAPNKHTQQKQRAAQQQLPANRQPHPPFWSPRQEGLSPAATYRLESMGTHVHLSPAMRWHLNRSRRTTSAPPANQVASAGNAPGQGAEKFYPGVSRLPTQKPFADLERPPSGLQSYWPLLLEGRQDPNTGLIIWSLP